MISKFASIAALINAGIITAWLVLRANDVVELFVGGCAVMVMLWLGIDELTRTRT